MLGAMEYDFSTKTIPFITKEICTLQATALSKHCDKPSLVMEAKPVLCVRRGWAITPGGASLHVISRENHLRVLNL